MRGFQLTRPLRGGTRFSGVANLRGATSTHTPLTRWNVNRKKFEEWIDISTHTPLTRWNPVYRGIPGDRRISTHTPLTRWNPLNGDNISTYSHFNSHTPYEVEPPRLRCLSSGRNFNSHTPYEVEPICAKPEDAGKHFNSHTPYEVEPNIL